MSGVRSSLLFVSPAFLQRRLHKPIRGVQVFDLHLLRQLDALGHSITVVAEQTWQERLEVQLAGTNVQFVWAPNLAKPLWNGLAALPRLKLAEIKQGQKWDVLLLGNATRGLVPVVDWAMRLGLAGCGVVIPHKMPPKASVKILCKHGFGVCAINTEIAGEFQAHKGGRPSVLHTQYGIPNADMFFPAEDAQSRAMRTPTVDDPLRLVVLGKLDEPWKGAQVAIDAVRALPEGVRERVELHLASYVDPAAYPGERIFAYPWMRSEEIPELLRKMDAMLVPSVGSQETFSQAVVQGMLTGLPILASPARVLAEKLDRGAGRVLPVEGEGTASAWADAVVELTEGVGHRARMGEAARQTALARYTWDTAWFSETFL